MAAMERKMWKLPCGIPHDRGKSKLQFPVQWMLLFLHHVQQDFSGLAACFFIEKMGCGQCGGRGPGDGGITEPGDLYLLRNRDFLLVEIPQGTGGQWYQWRTEGCQCPDDR